MFNGNGSMPSLADIAAVTGDRTGDGFGNGNGWWVLIILFAIFGGWGNGGWGNNARGNGQLESTATQADIQRGFDTQSILTKLNGIENGICSLGYDQLAQMNNIGQSIMQTGYNTQNTVQETGYNLRDSMQQNAIAQTQSANALQSTMQSGFCGVNENITQSRYDSATQACALTNAVNQAAQNIMQNDNANYRQLHDEIVQIQMNAKDEKIAEQQSLIQALNLAQSQANQNQYLVNQLRPSPVPSFSVPNPWSGYGYGCCNA